MYQAGAARDGTPTSAEDREGVPAPGWEPAAPGWEPTAPGWEPAALDWDPAALDWDPAALDWVPAALDWEPAALDWEPAALGWGPAAPGWGPAAPGWAPAAEDTTATAINKEDAESTWVGAESEIGGRRAHEFSHSTPRDVDAPLREGNRAPWSAKLKLLGEYVRKFRRLPSRSVVAYRGVNLGKWVDNQRRAGKGGRCMTPEQAAALEAVPGWYWKYDPKEEWEKNLAILCSYVEEFGNVPGRTRESSNYRGIDLGRWVYTQRKSIKSATRLTPEQVAALERVPGWERRHRENAWSQSFELLVDYVKECGRLPQSRCVYRDVTLGRWVRAQRRGLASLTPERRAALERVPGWKW